MTTRISKEQAKALIEEADAGVIAVLGIEHVPVIGTIEPEEIEVELETAIYRFKDKDVDDSKTNR